MLLQGNNDPQTKETLSVKDQMMFEARIIADSIYKVRLTTFLITYPRIIHSELMTHRVFAKNAASSRAIPWKKEREPGVLAPNCMYSMIQDRPFIPLVFGAEQKGMQTGSGEAVDQDAARAKWLEGRDRALQVADELAGLGVHKSIVNRITEPWMWITVLISGTDWRNLWRLRVHPDAEVHFQHIARMMKEAYEAGVPVYRAPGTGVRALHLPFVSVDERSGMDESTLKRVSAGRCARLSYLTHEGKRDISADIALFSRLIEREDNVLHATPLEHVAWPMEEGRSGCFRGWFQFRKEFANECAVEV